jgi:hypothetical protein
MRSCESARELVDALDVILDEVGAPDERALAVVVEGVLAGDTHDAVQRVADRTLPCGGGGDEEGDASESGPTTANEHPPRGFTATTGDSAIHDRETLHPSATMSSRAA